MINLQGMAGVFYFPDGWFGKPWDNFFKIQQAVESNGQLELTGKNWSLSGPINGLSSFDDSYLLDFKKFIFTFNGEIVSWDNDEDPVLFYFGDEYGSLDKMRTTLILSNARSIKS